MSHFPLAMSGNAWTGALPAAVRTPAPPPPPPEEVKVAPAFKVLTRSLAKVRQQRVGESDEHYVLYLLLQRRKGVSVAHQLEPFESATATWGVCDMLFTFWDEQGSGISTADEGEQAYKQWINDQL